MKHLFVRALQFLLLFGILGIPCLLSVTGGQQTESVQVSFKEGDRIREGNQDVGADRLLQFVAGGHVLGFRAEDVTIASGDHALRIEFMGSRSISPENEGTMQNKNMSQKGTESLDRVIYKDLWPGINLIYEKHSSGVVKSTYIVQPSGSDTSSSIDCIRLRYNVPVKVAENGSLIIPFETGQMTESRPVAWQEINGDHIPIDVSFCALSEQEIGFAVGSYDPQFPLVIDPVLSWMTFMGGTMNDSGRVIAVDEDGNVYVAGHTRSTWGTPVNPYTGYWDVFVAKLDSFGTRQWNTFLGSVSTEYANGIGVDGDGNVYVGGLSGDTWGTPINPYSGNGDAFAAKLDNDGNLLWNTFIGGADTDQGYGATLDQSGNFYVVGQSYASWGTPVNAHAGSQDAFAAKLNSNGVLQWNTFMGGIDIDQGYGIAVDQSGNVYVSGFSYASWGTPVNAHAGSRDSFAVKLNSSGALLWNTFMGGTDTDMSWGAAVDGSGYVYVTGYSHAPWGTPVNPHSGAGADAFAAKLNSSGDLIWHTFMGALAGEDQGMSIAVSGSGYVYVMGLSSVTWGNPIFPHFGDGSKDAMGVKLDSNGVLKQHTFMGGAGDDYGYGIAIDANGDAHGTGISSSAWGAPVNEYAEGTEAFVIKFSLSDPRPDIKANGSDSTITITQGDALQVTVALDPGEQGGEDADWWLLMHTSGSLPTTWYYFDYATRSWIVGRSPTRQGHLAALDTRQVPGTSGLPAGTYNFYFGVDLVMNGVVNVGAAFYDSVRVIINP